MSYLTEPQAWRRIAETWVTGTTNLLPLGTCPLIQRMYADEHISRLTMQRMRARLNTYLEVNGHPFVGSRIAYRCGEDWRTFATHIDEHREARALYALWLAHEAKENL